MALLKADIREVEHTVYGRDMRKPLADALIQIKKYYQDEQIKISQLSNVSVEHLSGECYLLKLETS